MVGTTVSGIDRGPVRAQVGEVVLDVAGVGANGDHGAAAITDVSLTVHKGEIVGIAGVAGSGQRELCEAVLGLRALTSGTVSIGGDAIPARPMSAIKAGAVAVPEDPVADSVVGGMTVLEHMALRGDSIPRKLTGIDWPAIKQWTVSANERAGLRMAALDRQVTTLSGGNIQRVILTRSLSDECALVVAGLSVARARCRQHPANPGAAHRAGHSRSGSPGGLRGLGGVDGDIRSDSGHARRARHRNRGGCDRRSILDRQADARGRRVTAQLDEPVVVSEPTPAMQRLERLGSSAGRWVAAVVIALLIFSVLIMIVGANPFEVFADAWKNTIQSPTAMQQAVIKAGPMILAALAVVIPARAGLVNVGGEGQLLIGAVAAAGAAMVSDGRLPGRS